MQIVFTREVANQLAEKYTLLQLDTINVEGYGAVETFCVLEPEAVVMEMASLAENSKLHEQLIEAIAMDDCASATGLCTRLKGCFGGELDSFYDIVIERIATTNTAKLQKTPIT